MHPEPPKGLRLGRSAAPPVLAAYFDNSAIYFKTFWQPWVKVTTYTVKHFKDGG